ncbi:MAG: SDR family NAD(P)-dependent oxidoreductase [Pseudomonadota bacterium]|jgi:2-hydroxycyclohexanecarboxyl-CoA dehydrogenase|nr:SDR family oxidoreductase [Rubrivivax sp.]MCA3257944.1 SDR family oxidoreductase [Rubrivivax sp.]MCE2911438.1 SDR family oxidoreductase [Rubrivivax sp.]MCZ8032352.1 SDR family NAD(P)-dependent oxidoreductase [Rubrivivax sp.]
MDLKLAGRTALVTGAGQGVGRRIALTLAAEGACVAVNDLMPDRVHRVVEEITAAGGTALAAPFDVTELDAVRAAVSRAGTIDILVNNAGIIPERRSGEVGLPPFVEQPPEHWRKIVELNLMGTLNVTHACLQGMAQRRYGKVVTIMSDAGRVGEARYVVYGAAKAAQAGMTRSLAKEVGPQRINVNAVSLSAVAHEAPMADFLREDASPDSNETLKKMLSAYPIGKGLARLTRPQDAANAVAFLVSDAAEYITGQVLSVNGGYAMP